MTLRRLTLSLASVVALALVTVAPAGAAEQPQAPAYVAVIDAGSSGTRLNVYSSRDANGLAPKVVFESSPNTKGLSSFAGTPELAGPDAIAPLLNQLNGFIEGQGLGRGDVPVALLGTAGLRTVRETQPEALRPILASTRATLDASGYPVLENRILPAVKEGSLAWLDANALAGTLNKKRGGVGIVEIGGASAQVAFRSSEPRGRGVTRVTVNGTVIPVVAVSYLGLGGNLAREDMQKRAGGGAVCFPNNAADAQPTTYATQTSIPVTAATADFSLPACRAAFASTVKAVGSKKSVSAMVAPAQLRSTPGFTDSTFIGLGSIPFTFADLQIAADRSSRAALVAQVRTTCTGANAWAKVLALSPKISSPFGDTLCANGAYVDALVFSSKGVGIAPKDFNGRPSFAGRSPSWPAGYAITVLNP